MKKAFPFPALIILLFAWSVTPVFASAPLSPGEPLVANVSNSGFDVVLLLDEAAECGVRFGFGADETQWSAENVAEPLFPSGPARLHWLRVRIADPPEEGCLVYFIASPSARGTPCCVRLPRREAPVPPSTFLEAAVLTSQDLPPREARSLALVRLGSGPVRSAFRAAPLSEDERQVRLALDGLPNAAGSFDEDGAVVFGGSFPPEPGARVEIVVLVEGRPPAVFEGEVTDAAAGVYDPDPGVLTLSLAAPRLSAPPASSGGSFTLRWEAVPDAAGYLVERSSGGEWEAVAELGALAEPAFEQSGLSWGTWRYRARALASLPGRDGPWSEVAEVRVLPPPQGVPSPPSALASSQPSPQVSWEGVFSPAPGTDYYYEVEWSRSPDFSAASRFTTAAAAAVLPLGGGGTWYWRVRAVLPGENGVETGPWSDPAVITVRTGVPVPEAPQFVSSPRFTLRWSAVPAIPPGTPVAYRAQLAREPDFSDASEAAETTGLSASLWLSSPGQWYVRVRAETQAGAGDWSEAAAVYLESADRAAPASLRCIPVSGSVVLVWEVRAAPEVPQAVQRRTEGGEWVTVAEDLSGDTWGDSDPPSGETLLEYRVGAVFAGGTEWSRPASVRLPSRVSGTAPAALAACGDGDEMLALAWFPDTEALSLLVLHPPSAPASGDREISLGRTETAGGLPALAVVRTGADTALAFYTEADEYGFRRPAAREVALSGGGSAGEAEYLGEEWTDAAALAAASDGGGLCCVIYYDTLTEAYYLQEREEEGAFREPRFLAASSRLPDVDAHRPALAFDADGNLHFAFRADEGEGDTLLYGIMVRVEGDEALSEPRIEPLPADGGAPLAVAGLYAGGGGVLLSFLEDDGGTVRLVSRAGRPSPGGGMEWDEPVVQAWGVERAQAVFPGGRAVQLGVVPESPAGGVLYAFVESGGEMRSLPVAGGGVDAFCAVPSGTGAAVLFSEAAGLMLSAFEAGDAESNFGSPSGGGGGGCFVATAAFGSMGTRAVRELTRLRDGLAADGAQGRALVELYYRVSPPVARRERGGLRALMRRLLSAGR